MALEPLELVTGSCGLPDVGVESQILVFCESNLDTTAEPSLQLLFSCETFFCNFKFILKYLYIQSIFS